MSGSPSPGGWHRPEWKASAPGSGAKFPYPEDHIPLLPRRSSLFPPMGHWDFQRSFGPLPGRKVPSHAPRKHRNHGSAGGNPGRSGTKHRDPSPPECGTDHPCATWGSGHLRSADTSPLLHPDKDGGANPRPTGPAAANSLQPHLHPPALPTLYSSCPDNHRQCSGSLQNMQDIAAAWLFLPWIFPHYSIENREKQCRMQANVGLQFFPFAPLQKGKDGL